MISRFGFSQDLTDFERNMTDSRHLRSESELGVGNVGIYVEYHYYVIKKTFAYDLTFTFWFPNALAYQLEDPLISETCALEENASHHLTSRSQVS